MHSKPMNCKIIVHVGGKSICLDVQRTLSSAIEIVDIYYLVIKMWIRFLVGYLRISIIYILHPVKTTVYPCWTIIST